MKVYKSPAQIQRGYNDLEETIERQQKQIEFLQKKCREAGERIKDLEEINSKHQSLVGKLMENK
tara:strand:- start:529 stop:720 length:192 start_codon:yes stop_codon:yes gene_type:complete